MGLGWVNGRLRVGLGLAWGWFTADSRLADSGLDSGAISRRNHPRDTTEQDRLSPLDGAMQKAGPLARAHRCID